MTVRCLVTHDQAVWERTRFDVEVPDEFADDPEAWVAEHIDELMGDAITAKRATVEVTDSVRGFDDELEVERL